MAAVTLQVHPPARRVLPRILAAVALAGAVVVALPVAVAQADADFLAAKDAFERGDRARLERLAPGLAGHVLTPYVRYWQLTLGIDTAEHDAVRDFLARYPNTPLAERLRVDWLKSVGRRGDWVRFALDYPPPAGEDTELACYGVQYRLQRDGAAALAAAKPLWLTGQSTPEACDSLFAALFARDVLGVADRRARFRLAAEAGNLRLASALLADYPPQGRPTSREFAEVGRDPARALAKGAFAWKTAAGEDVALFALERAARRAADAARPSWVKWRQRLPKAAQHYGNGRLAFHAARQLNPLAHEWYREAGAAPLALEPQVWRVRAALRALAWSDVGSAVDGLPERERQEPAWRYWRARALAADGAAADARAVYEELASDIGFYGLLAGDALGRGAEQLSALKSEPARPTAETIAVFGARPEVRRVVKLAALDMRRESQREWYFLVRGQDDATLLLAAEFARRAGLYDRAINTAELTAARHDYALRYLMPYRDEFGAAARDQGIDVEFLYAIARQESRFVSDIVSSAGAVGLMQLMPGTARWVAKRLAQTDYRSGQIAQIDLNTQFGAFYFKYWQDRLDQMPALAAAAYNAGPSRAQAWRPAAAPLEGAIWVETIPFNETRDYVKKVLANAILYTHALDRPYVPLSVRLGTVVPRGASASAVAARPE
jgi:soluble lytic murein transglycosylase